MVTILKRMRRLRSRLLDIRLGPGAAVLSSDVQRIHLKFARKINDGHMGPRKFWHHYLPRLKYHNPAIPMTVERTDDQEGPASLTVFFGPQSSANATSASANEASSNSIPQEISRSIDMKHKKENAILSELLQMTKGEPVDATPEDEEALQVLEAEEKRSETDRARQEEVMRQRKRQAELLRRAKQSS